MQPSPISSAAALAALAQLPYGRWAADVNARQVRLASHEHALCAFADAHACDAAARRLQRAYAGRPHCRRLRPEAMERRLRAASAARPPAASDLYRAAGALEGLLPLVREGCHWLMVRVDSDETLHRLRRALRGQPVRCALLFGDLAVEDLLPRRKGRPRPGVGKPARGSHRGGSSPAGR